MADQDDFMFDDQDSDSEEWYEEEPEKKKGGSRSRLLLLLLLLIAIAGGAYYYFMMMPADEGPAAPTKKVVKLKKKAVTMPAKPESAKKTVPMPVQKDAKAEPKPAEKTVAKSADNAAPAEKVPAKMPVKKTAPDKPAAVPASEPVKVAEKPDAKPVSEKVSAKLPPTPKQVFEKPAEKKPAISTGGAYSLTAGTYLLDSSVKNVSKKIRALGYEPTMTPVKRKVKMTRLKLGTFSKATAATKLAELKSVAPGAFSIREGKSETVYAGSYLVLDKARRFADQLYKKGIRLDEVPVEMTKTLQRVTFGTFASSDDAKAAARQAAAKGVEAQVYENR